MGPYVNLVLRASDSFKESTVDSTELVSIFNGKSRELDSLLTIYIPLDTLSSGIGLQRVYRIAQSYTDLAMYEYAIKWWKLLKRVDQKGYFEQEIFRGMLEAGVGLSDSLRLAELLSGAELRDVSVKRKLGRDMMSAMSFLFLHRADMDWLDKRLRRLKRFLPEVDAVLFEGKLLSARGKWLTAYGLYKWLLEKTSPFEITPDQARRFLEELYKTSLLSGKAKEAGEILACIIEHGDSLLVSRARLWSTHIDVLEGRLDLAQERYGILCSEGADVEVSCFWRGFIQRYKDVSANVQ